MEIGKKSLAKLGKRVRQLRLAKGWTQEECAYEAQMSAVYLSGIERGTRNPTVKNLARLAAALEVHLADLFKI
jgi:transcriptional regulator with XRE-family HTH domain